MGVFFLVGFRNLTKCLVAGKFRESLPQTNGTKEQRQYVYSVMRSELARRWKCRAYNKNNMIALW
ncbi:hypothetical protein BGZ63DRAFT_223703 [Mariannaea sp. PMI_226]|nr:hypothetical protein BGZ63DRAFT_223703 [Mariannaea sp. PMI_226]